MIEQLNVLRNKIDKIDRTLLNLLSKRFLLVSQIGEIKSRFGLLIYDSEREEQIISYRRMEAVTLGLSPDLVEDLLRRIMSESYCNENEKGFLKLRPNLRSIVIVGGRGKMGQFFFKMLTLSGYTVRILDRNDWIYAESILKNVELIFISVPIHLVTSVMNILPRLPSDCIVVDLSSLKKISLQSILDIHTGPVLGLHPMFNPDVGNMIKQIVIYCDGRYPEAYQWLLKQIRLWGARLYCCNFMEHDKYMSFIQGLSHFITFIMGYNLFRENANLNKILSFSSPIFRLELLKIGRFFTQDPILYTDIIIESKENIVLIKRYYKRLKKILVLLEQNNKEEFLRQFEKIKCWMNIYSDILLQDSNKILKQINDFNK